MSIRAYLPSAQFAVIVAALAISGVLVYAASYYTHPHYAPAGTLATDAGGSATTGGAIDWKSQFGNSTAFADSQTLADTAQKLIGAAKTNNLTDTLGRSLLLNTASLQGQGISASTDAQSQVVASALSQIQGTATAAAAYTAADFTVVADSKDSLHAYGNALANAVGVHTAADYTAIMIAVGLMVDNGDKTQIGKLSAAASDYAALAKDIRAFPTPASLSSLALAAANNYAKMGKACTDMQSILTDPVLGLASIQQYDALAAQNGQVFTQIALVLQKNAILFGKNEAGAAWSKFLALSQAAQAQAAQEAASGASSQ